MFAVICFCGSHGMLSGNGVDGRGKVGYLRVVWGLSVIWVVKVDVATICVN
jgi:hypothetical protein